MGLQKSAVFTRPVNPLAHSVLETVPARGRLVAAYPYYYASPAIGFCGQASVLGYPADVIATHHAWYFVAPFGSMQRCGWVNGSALERWRGDALVVAGGWAERPLLSPAQSALEPAGSVTVRRFGNDEIEGDIRTASGGVLVFRNEFDPRWTLSDGGRVTGSRLVDGFANGWIVPPGDRHFHLWFAPAGYVRAAVALGLIWLIVLLGELTRVLRDPRYRTASQ